MADLQDVQGAALVRALCLLTDEAEMRAFLSDLLTVGEIADFVQRWWVARLLLQGLTYEEVSKQAGVSTATISRIRKFVEYGAGGYRAAARRVDKAE